MKDKMEVPVVNLKRAPDPTRTVVRLWLSSVISVEWIRAGSFSLSPVDRLVGEWLLSIRRENATDRDHDAAVALRLPLYGVRLDLVMPGQTVVSGLVSGMSEEDFRIPEPEFDQLAGSVACDMCKPGHLFVAEGKWIPPVNKALYELARGKRVEIRTGSWI